MFSATKISKQLSSETQTKLMNFTQCYRSCFFFFKNEFNQVDYTSAKAACVELGLEAMLAAPKTATILDALNKLNVNETDVWIGLDDR